MAFSRILQRALGLLGVGVATCDERLAVIAYTDLAREIFEGFAAGRFQPGHLVPPAIRCCSTAPT